MSRWNAVRRGFARAVFLVAIGTGLNVLIGPVRAAPQYKPAAPAVPLAQTPNATAIPAPETPVEPDAAGGDPLADVEPYKRWRHHEGNAQESIALLKLQNGTTTSAVVMRCDGFLIVPHEIYDEMDGGRPVVTAVTGAEGEARIAAPIPVAARSHIVTGAARTDYGIVKINDHHVRCLRLLAASNIQPGMPARIVFAIPDPSDPAHCLPVTYEATIGELADLFHWGLADVKPSRDSGSPASATNGVIPAGAVVVDAESGAGIGIVTRSFSAGSAASFSSFAYLNDLTDDMTLAPSRQVLKLLHDPKALDIIENDGGDLVGAPGLQPGRMVHIHGHPVAIQGTLLEQYRRLYHTEVACTPDFYIDVYPASNAEYREWLLAHPFHPQPGSWKNDELRYPERRPDMPATGMNISEALAYAADKNKRLVTGVEWQIAARVASLDALQDVNLKIKETLSRWDALVAALKEYDQRIVQRADLLRRSGRGSGYEPVPPDAAFASLVQDSLNAIDEISGGGLEEGKNSRNTVVESWMHLPYQIMPLDTFDADASVYGVRHVLMNAPEMLAPLGRHTSLAPKPQAARSDPYLSHSGGAWNLQAFSSAVVAGSVNLSGGGDKRYVDLQSSDGFLWMSAYSGSSLYVYSILQSISQNGRRQPATAETATWFINLYSHNTVQPGFRCAR